MHQIMAPRKTDVVLSHSNLIQNIVRGSMSRSDEAYEDAISAGNVGFLQAFPRYDPNAGHPVGTFVYKSVDGEVKKVRREAASIIKTPPGQDRLKVDSLSGPAYKGSDEDDTELVEILPDSVPSAEKIIIREERARRWKADLVRALRVLTRREYRIYHARRLTAPPILLETLAEELGVSRERVRQIEYAAASKVDAQRRKLKGHVDNRLVVPQPPQLSWLDEERLVKAYISKGFSEETARALAGRRDARTEARAGLPGSDDRHWCKPPQAIWRAAVSRIPKKHKSDAKPQPSSARKPKRIAEKPQLQFPVGVVSSPIKINPYRAQIDEFLSKRGARK